MISRTDARKAARYLSDASRYYEAHAVSSREQERREYFKGYADKLEAVGYKVFNPMENGLPFNAEHEEHMKKDIRELLKCDAIVMLRGWQLSKGCCTEWEVAKAVGLRILYESDLAAVLEYKEGGAL